MNHILEILLTLWTGLNLLTQLRVGTIAHPSLPSHGPTVVGLELERLVICRCNGIILILYIHSVSVTLRIRARF